MGLCHPSKDGLDCRARSHDFCEADPKCYYNIDLPGCIGVSML